jgi:hypothetical protein
MIAAVAMGRFSGPTIEHEKLLDRLMATPADVHFIFVFGPTIKTDFRNPQIAHAKARVIGTLYPVCYVTGSHRNPFTALRDLNDHVPLEYLRIVAGTGYKGIMGADTGGSVEEYLGVAQRAGITADVIGVAQERGEVSGTMLREAILKRSPLDQIRSMMHSRLTDDQISTFIESLYEIERGHQHTT